MQTLNSNDEQTDRMFSIATLMKSIHYESKARRFSTVDDSVIYYYSALSRIFQLIAEEQFTEDELRDIKNIVEEYFPDMEYTN